MEVVIKTIEELRTHLNEALDLDYSPESDEILFAVYDLAIDFAIDREMPTADRAEAIRMIGYPSRYENKSFGRGSKFVSEYRRKIPKRVEDVRLIGEYFTQQLSPYESEAGEVVPTKNSKGVKLNINKKVKVSTSYGYVKGKIVSFDPARGTANIQTDDGKEGAYPYDALYKRKHKGMSAKIPLNRNINEVDLEVGMIVSYRTSVDKPCNVKIVNLYPEQSEAEIEFVSKNNDGECDLVHTDWLFALED